MEPESKLPAKRGRKPITFTAAVLKEIEDMAGKGLLDKEIVLNLGISLDTFYEKKKHLPEFSEALARGRAKGVRILTNKLWENATEMAVGPKGPMGTPGGNVEAQKFILARRYGWREVDQVQEGSTVERITFERIQPGRAPYSTDVA